MDYGYWFTVIAIFVTGLVMVMQAISYYRTGVYTKTSKARPDASLSRGLTGLTHTGSILACICSLVLEGFTSVYGFCNSIQQ